MAVGHEKVVESLRRELPPVALFHGPPAVGKWTVANEVLAEQGISPDRLLTFDAMTVENAVRAVTFCRTRSFAGAKAVVARIDGASEASMNRLLKVLEDPPGSAHFILVAASEPMLTVASRAQVFRFGYLTDDEVATVLVTKHGFSLDRAETAAARAGGRVDRALDVARVEEAKGMVLSVLKASAEGDEDLFYNAVGGRKVDRSEAFGPRQLDLLRVWATEATTGRWRVFSPQESFGLHLDATTVARVLRVTSRVERPRVAVRASLLPVLWERSRGLVVAG